jgi:arylsulfatase A-like enzyme
MEEKRERLEKEGVPKKAIARRARGPAFEAADVADDAYPDGELARMGVEALRELAAKRKPFFLAVGFLKPHLPFNAPKRYWDLHERSEFRLPENGSAPRGAPSFALADFGELRSYDAIPAKGAVPEETARTLIHGYYACVSYVDAQIGRLLAELETLGLRRNTIVVVWGDHGWKLGEHGSWCKHTNFELDTRSTLIASAPGAMGSGRSTRALVEFVDIYPTLCDLAGLPLPDHLEGRSFAPLLADPRREWKRAAFSQYPRGKLMGYSMRTDRYRFTLWLESAAARRRAGVELYDHAEDPGENVNVAEDPRNAGLLERLTADLEAGWKGALPSGK